MKLDVKEFETKMQKSIASYEYELSSIRVGEQVHRFSIR